MYDCIKERSTEAAAEAILQGTIRIWTDRETAAQDAAERDAGADGADETERCRVGWAARTRAFATRGPVIWTVYATPERKHHWLIAPPTLETQTEDRSEAEEARSRGDLVVEPDDRITDIVNKMEAARAIRATSGV